MTPGDTTKFAPAAIEVDAANLRVRVDAAATVSDLERQTKEAGTRVPGLETAEPDKTIGATLAAGSIPRRSVLAIDAVINGQIVRSAAPVLKDVAGYDLTSLLIGSGSRIGEIVAAWFRLVPREAEVWIGETSGGKTADALEPKLAGVKPA